VVARRVADIVEVIVLAAGANAFLRRGGGRIRTAFKPGEDVLEWHHPGIDEHQSRIVVRDERRRRHRLMPFGREEIEEGAANVVGGRHRPDLGEPPPVGKRGDSAEIQSKADQPSSA
jgi:hypothetical protein